MHAQVYKGVLNKTKAVAVKTFAHMASEAEVIRFNAVSLCGAFPAPIQCHRTIMISNALLVWSTGMLVLTGCMAPAGHPNPRAPICAQEVQIMQTLSEIPELVTCFTYSPKPRPQGKATPYAPRQLVMELMEVCLGSPASVV